MKKFVFAAAMTAAIVSTNAHAESFAESCGHIENHTRFNPTELSEYQECWLGFHKPDEMAGVLGNIFWARAGDMTVSMPVSELRSAGSKDAAKAIVVDRIVDRIVEVERELTQAQRDAIAMFERFSAVTDEATAKAFVLAETGIIVFTSAEVAAAEELARNSVDITTDNQAAIDGARQGIIDGARVGYVTEAARDLAVDAVTIDTNIDGRFHSRGRGDRAMVVTLTNGLEIRVNADDAFDAGANEINGEVHNILRGSAGLGYVVNDSWNADQNTYYALVHVAAQAIVNAKAAALSAAQMIDSELVAGTAGYAPTPASDPAVTGSATNAAGENFGILTVTVRNDSGNYENRSLGSWTQRAEDSINDAIDQAYDQGFGAGYDEGYADGYRDGFADGVASVN